MTEQAPGDTAGAPRIRVLHLIYELGIGGSERLVAELATRLDPARFEVHVAPMVRRGIVYDDLVARGVPAVFIGKRPGPDLRGLARVVRLLRGRAIDILHTHAFAAGLWGRLAAMLAGTPVTVATVHSVPGWNRTWRHVAANALVDPFTDRLVAVSESVRKAMIQRERRPARRTCVIHNGIDCSRFRRPRATPAEREALGLPGEAPVVGMVARCSPEKGGADFVDMLAVLRESGRPVRGVLVGDGTALADWRARAASRGLANDIGFVGADLDVPQWLCACDVLVCPSRQESFGLVALEGQAAGVPVVATRIDGFLEVLHDGRDALLAPPGDAAALADAVGRVLDSSRLRAELIAAGRANVDARYGIATTVRTYAALYGELMRRRGGED